MNNNNFSRSSKYKKDIEKEKKQELIYPNPSQKQIQFEPFKKNTTNIKINKEAIEQKNDIDENNIEKEEKEKKSKLIILLYFFIGIILIITIIAIYARYIEPKILIVREYKITNNLIPDNFHGIKIIHFSDIHYKSTIFESDLNKIIDQINLLNPDIVVFTGDLLQSNYEYNIVDKEFLTNKLNSITTTIGKYYVTGDNDTSLSNDIFYNASFINLDNTYDKIYYNTNDYINIIGVGNKESVSDIINEYYTYNIVISHYPDEYEKYSESNLFLAGHSHNIQIKVPFVDNFINTNNSELYYDKYYKVNNSEIFISGGLGTSDVKMRLGSFPSINLYRLTNK